MPKFTQIGPDSFRAEMEPGDAREAEISDALLTIMRMAKSLETRPHDAAARAKDRGGYWRYSEVERSLDIIRREAERALLHIKFLDFPESIEPAGSA